MTTQLQYTSSIFQLALGVNTVFAILINQYLSMRGKLVDEFIQKLKNHNPSLSLNGKKKHLIKFLYRAMRGFRVINAYFIVCVVFAVFSSGVSLYYLLEAALTPSEEISSWLLTTLTVCFLVANPLLYFGFLRASDWLLLQFKNNLTIQADHVSFIEQSIEISELCDSTDEMIAKAQISAWRYKWQVLIMATEKSVDANSRANRTPIPRDSGHRFHLILDSDSRRIWTVVPFESGQEFFKVSDA